MSNSVKYFESTYEEQPKISAEYPNSPVTLCVVC